MDFAFGLVRISTETNLEFKQRSNDIKTSDMAQVLNLTMEHMRSCEINQVVEQLSMVKLETTEPKSSELSQIVDHLSMVQLEEPDSQHLPSSSHK